MEFGIELWACASTSNTKIAQCTQNKIIRAIVDAPWYVTNEITHRDLEIKIVKDCKRII